MFENKLFSFSDLSVEKKIWPAGLFFTHTPPPLGQDVAEFRAGEKGILSGQRSFFLAIWLSNVEGWISGLFKTEC